MEIREKSNYNPIDIIIRLLFYFINVIIATNRNISFSIQNNMKLCLIISSNQAGLASPQLIKQNENEFGKYFRFATALKGFD